VLPAAQANVSVVITDSRKGQYGNNSATDRDHHPRRKQYGNRRAERSEPLRKFVAAQLTPSCICEKPTSIGVHGVANPSASVTLTASSTL